MRGCGYSCTSSYVSKCQEIPVEPEDRTWVCDCTREGGLLCGAKFSTKRQLTTHIMYTSGRDSWFTRSRSMRATITHVGPWCQLVFSNRTTLSHLPEHTRDHIDCRDTRSQPSDSTCSKTACQTETFRSCFIVWPWTRSFLSTGRKRIAVRSAHARRTEKGRRCKTKKLWRSFSSKGTQVRTGNQEVANVRESGLPETATWQPRSSQPTKSSEPASRMRGSRSSRTSCCGVDRPGMNDGVSADSSAASSSRPSGTSRWYKYARAHGRSEAGQNAQGLGYEHS